MKNKIKPENIIRIVGIVYWICFIIKPSKILAILGIIYGAISIGWVIYDIYKYQKKDLE